MKSPPDQALTPPQKTAAILAAAVDAFSEHGFRNADVQAIADSAGVGKGTVYRHFGNKEDLFWATVFHVFQELEKHLLASMEGIDRPLEKLRAAGLAYAGFFERNPQFLEVFVQDRAEFRGSVPKSHRDSHEEMIRRFSEIVEDGIAQGELLPVDVRKTIHSLAAVLQGCVVFGCYWKDDYSLIDITEHTLDAFLEGIRPKGPAREEEK
jgi:AcrR family transcriptional regulator